MPQEAARQCVRRLAAAGGGGRKKRKRKECFPCPGDRCPWWPREEGSATSVPVLAFYLPLPFAALGGTTSICWVPHLDEAPVPHRSLLDPLHGATAFVPESSRGTGAWFWDPLSVASQSPDPRCLLVLGGLLWLL